MTKKIATAAITSLLVTLSMVAPLMIAPQPALAQETQSFFDVPATDPDFLVIEKLKAIGVIQGRADGTFGPDEQITRAEALKIILKAAGLPDPVEPFQTNFSDVPADSWYIGYVSQAEQLGIIHGNPDGTFLPDSAINRAEFLKLLLTASNENFAEADMGTPENPVAPDAAPDDWFTPYISYAKTVSIIFPDLQDRLGSADILTRIQGAKCMYKLYVLRNGSKMEDLMALTDSHINETLVQLDGNKLNTAFRNVGAAVFYSGLAVRHNVGSTIFLAANDISAGLRELIRAYYQVSLGNAELAQQYVTEAETLADQAAANDSVRQALATKIHQLGDALLTQ